MAVATILLVEDDQTILLGMAHVLEHADYAVVTAGNGKEGLVRLSETTPDLILSDIMMPVMGGYEFYEALRANPAWELIPFIFVTAMGRPQEIREGKLLGVDDYLIKPFEVDDLLVAVESRLRRARGIKEATRYELRTLKDRILALLNHELRTPLTHIQGYSELVAMDGTELDPELLTQFLSRIGGGSQRLVGLVEDLLLVVEIEAGQAARAFEKRKMQLELGEPFIAGVAARFEAQAIKKGIDLDVEIPAGLPPVIVDTDFLGNALGRVLDNAIKFSPPDGAVEVIAQEYGAELQITVTDQGRGIPLDEQPFIFDVFHQIDREQYEQQGAGLGLTIARGLVELHGGRIEVESQEGIGSVFTLALPTV